MKHVPIAKAVPVTEGSRVTQLELFFDLVFVFALTQVTALMAADLTWTGMARGLLVLGLLWWSWIAFAWLGNVVSADEGIPAFTLVVAMTALFVVALAIPEAFDDGPGNLSGPLVVAAGYVIIRVAHLATYWISAGDDAALRRQLLKLAVPMVGAAALLIVASQFSGTAQTLLWAAALLVDYLGTLAGGASGWRVRSAVHFAERHGLIVIIALGESIVAVGVGVAQEPITVAIVTAAALALMVSASLWWLYFDVAYRMGEEALAHSRGEHRARLARDGYTYLHLPIVAGVILLALGLKKVLEYVADTSAHGLDDPLKGLGLYAMYGGVSLFLLGHAAFKWRLVQHPSYDRIAVAVLLLVAIPAVAQLPALGSLAVLATVLLLLQFFERRHFADVREQVRHPEAEAHDG